MQVIQYTKNHGCKMKKQDLVIKEIDRVNKIYEEDTEVEKFLFFLKRIKDKVISFVQEIIIFVRNTSYFKQLIIFSFLTVSSLSIKEYLKLKRIGCGTILQQTYYDNNNELISGVVESVFLISFFHSILLGVFFSFLVLILTLIVSCTTYFVKKKNRIKNFLLNLSKFCCDNSFNCNIVLFSALKIYNFGFLLFVFLCSQVFFNYNIFDKFLKEKSEIYFIKKNISLGVNKGYIIYNNILPHCNLNIVENYIKIFISYIAYIDIFPSLATEIPEIRTRSFYTFVFLIYLSIKNLSDTSFNPSDPIVSTYVSKVFLLYIFLTYLFLIIIILHVKDYFIKRNGIYQVVYK